MALLMLGKKKRGGGCKFTGGGTNWIKEGGISIIPGGKKRKVKKR